MRTKLVQFCCWATAGAPATTVARDRTTSPIIALRRGRMGRLEFESHADLGMAGRAERACHQPELRIANGSVGRRKPRCIAEIKEFAANLKPHAFAYRELLAEGEIGVVDSVAAQIREISRRVSGDLVSRVR